MPQLIVTIPSTDPTLRREIKQDIEEYADVRQSQSYTDPETVRRESQSKGSSPVVLRNQAAIIGAALAAAACSAPRPAIWDRT